MSLSGLLLLSAAGAAPAEETGSIAGYAFAGGSGEPIAGASVAVGDRRALSDDQGAFSLPLPQGIYTVELRAPGQTPGQLLDVAVGRGQITEILVTFTPDAIPTALIQAPERTAPAEEAPAGVPGRLPGQVLDPDGAPIEGARIYVKGQDAQATSDAQGRFELVLPSGEHTLSILASGYTTATIPGVQVTPEGSATRPFTLSEARPTLDSFTISAPYIEGSVASLLDERRESSSVADVLGAEEMSRSGASDAASALSRVTGLTVVGGKYVFVRGMGDRYSSSLLNGAMLPSPEPERRVVPMDLFPASILESVMIQKSWSPDMPGEFGGGVVRLRTVRPPRELVAKLSVSTGATVGTTLAQGLDYQGGGTDWLGLDGGSRALPGVVADASDQSPLLEGDRFSDLGYSAEELETLGEAMPNNYEAFLRSIPPDLGLGASLGHGGRIGRVEVGVLGALIYSNSWQTLRFDRTYFDVGEGGSLQRQNSYAFDQTTNEIQLGGFLTGGLQIGEDQSVRYVGMLNRSADDTARVYEGFNGDVGGDLRITRLRWVERQLLYHQLLGRHDLGRWLIEWRGSLAGAGRLEPDRREYRFDNEQGTDRWLLSDRPEGNQRFFSDSSERFTELGTDLTLRLDPRAPETTGTLKVGSVIVSRSRGVDTRRYKYFHRDGASRDQEVLALDIEDILTPDHIGPGGFQFGEFTQPTDNYTASQQIAAGYGMLELPLSSWLRLMGGLRVEHSRQEVQTFELFNPDSAPVEAGLSNLDPLPGGSLTLGLAPDVQLRLGLARTVSRPEFRELSPATFNDVTGGRQTFGNPELQRATIDHYDLRLEWFPSPGESASISGFYKRLQDPVETIIIPSAQQSLTWTNAAAADNLGLELEFRKELPLNLFSSGNLALIQSRIVLESTDGIQTSNERPLQGQSPYVLNLQLGWDDPETPDQITLLYNVIGPRISEVGALGLPDAYELPVHQLDLVSRLGLSEHLTLSLKGSNLLDATAVVLQGDETYEAIARGRRFSIGLSWRP